MASKKIYQLAGNTVAVADTAWMLELSDLPGATHFQPEGTEDAANGSWYPIKKVEDGVPYLVQDTLFHSDTQARHYALRLAIVTNPDGLKL